jgi:hypothetical protein
MKRAFVLGNGRSRLNADLNLLKTKGKIYGCNALYREFEPDVLIAVDPKMIIEICNVGYQNANQVWTNPNRKYREYKNLNFFDSVRGWSSGPTALLKACMDTSKEIYILGFDYHGLENLVNNVYSGTPNYKGNNDSATYFGNWLKQTEAVFKEFPKINFIRVTGPKCLIVKEWKMINNVKDITYDDFNKLIQTF